MPIVNKILIGIVVLGCFSCQQPACDIKGELAMPACHEGTVYLQVMDDQTMQPRIVDSTVLQNGKFHFAYDGATPKTGIMAVSKNGETLWGTQFIIEPGDISLLADQQGHTHIGGTSNNDLLQKHLDRWNQPLEKMQAVNALPVKASVPQAHIFKSAIPHLVKVSSGKYRCEAPHCGLYTHICNIEKRLPIPAPPVEDCHKRHFFSCAGKPLRNILVPFPADTVHLHGPLYGAARLRLSVPAEDFMAKASMTPG